jgi:hypothetical protein
MNVILYGATGNIGGRILNESSAWLILFLRQIQQPRSAFMLKEPQFAFNAATISRKRTVGADDAMAGNHYANWIGAIGQSYCSRALRPVNLPCELGG